MAYRVIWSDEAQEQVRDILKYLQNAFGDAAAERFSVRLAEVSDLLERMPRAGMRHPVLTAVRELPVHSYHLIVYTVFKQEVFILNVVDSRRRKDRL